MNIYYDKDCDLSIIQGKKVTVVGYGSQGHAHANNLKDSGVDVTVALREGSTSAAKAEAAGLKVKNTADAIRDADLVMILTPDEFQRDLYDNEIEPNIKQGAAMAFAHGFAIHYNQVVPRADLRQGRRHPRSDCDPAGRFRHGAGTGAVLRRGHRRWTHRDHRNHLQG
jgi:ketol-acid reductoisomerase